MPEKILSLHKYWIYADKMRLLFKEVLTKNADEILEQPKNEIEAILKSHLTLLSEVGIFKSFWYSSLYTVIEGYSDLKLSIPEIDELLNDDYIDKLRLFRNGTYHYQKEIYNPKLLGVDQSDDFVKWIYKIHKELGNHIIKTGMNQFDKEIQDKMKDNLKSILGDGALKIFE